MRDTNPNNPNPNPNPPNQLTIEQEFKLIEITKEVSLMNEKQLRCHVINLVKLSMLKDSMYKQLLNDGL